MTIRSGPRLTLRPVTVADVEPAYRRWMNDPLVTQYLESRFIQHTADDLRRYIAAADEDPDVHLFAIVDEHGQHIGNIKLGPINREHSHGDIGIIIGERCAWGRGYATEAINILVDLAFADLGLHRVIAGAYASNQASIHAFLRAGFEIEGKRRQHYRSSGEWVDGVLLGRAARQIPDERSRL